MYYLGILMICVLSIVISDLLVYWEMVELGVMLMCVVLSYLCFGYFEYFYYCCELEKVCQLADFVICYYWLYFVDDEDKYCFWFIDVVVCIVLLIV